MKQVFTKAIVVLFLFFGALKVSAQITGINYAYATTTTAFIGIGAPQTIIAGGTDDGLALITPLAANWNGFYYGGVYYPAGTPIYVSSNGFISFINPVTSLPANNLAGTPAVIAPLWDDLKIKSTGLVKWGYGGGAPNRTMTIEWDSVLWDHNAAVIALSFQIRIFERTAGVNANVIEFRYLNNGAGVANINNLSGGASCGLSGFCNNDVLAWPGAPGGAVPNKNFPENSAIASHPSSTNGYRFTPVAHPYDNCANADTISSAVWPTAASVVFNPALPLISRSGTTLQSTQTAIALPSCGGVTTTSDVWYTFTKPANITNFEVYTDNLDCRGVNYSAGIEVFSSCGGAVVGCNLGATGPVGTNATSYLNLTSLPCAQTQYWMRVFSTDTSYRGYFRVNIRPPGRDCAYANQICGIPYASPPNLSTCGFGNDYDSTNSACHTPRQQGEDYLFTYTPASNVCVDISLNNTPANSYPGFTVYQGCPTVGNCLSNVSGPGVAPLTFSNMSLVAGITYYFAVDYDANGGFISCMNNFDLSITTSVAPTPTYDNCATPAGPVPVSIVTPGNSCTGLVDYNNNCASPSGAGAVPLPGCGTFIDGVTPDVWLTFTSTSTASHQIDVSPGTAPAAQDLAMAVYTSSGGSCGPFTLVNCDDNSNSGMPSLTVVPPTSSTVYYIRIWSNSGTQTGNFKICVATGCAPTNDLPCAAVALTLGQPVTGDNGCSSGANEPGNASCWGAGNTLNTVWYSFVASSTTMKIRTRLFTLYDSQIAVYSGVCGPGLVEVAAACNNDYSYNCGNAFTTKASDLTVNGLSIGTTYYVRVDGRGSNTGTFEIIVIDGAAAYPPVPSQDCALPVNICSNSSFTVADPGYSGAGNYCDAGGASICMYAGESSSSWYTFSITGPATLQWLLTTSISNDYDWMIWCIDTVWNNNPNHVFATVANYCSNLNNPNMFPWTSCNVSHIDNTGMSTSMGTDTVGGVTNQHRNVGGGSTPPLSQAGYIPAGMTATFLLSLNNWSNTTVGFNFNFQGSAVNGSPPTMTWQNATSNVWDGSGTNRNAWSPTSCGAIPDCINLIAATIAAGGIQPTVTASTTVKDITINAGASLTIQAGVILSVCGNFTNNGTLNCQPGSTVQFIGGSNTSINGTYGNVLNNFYHVEFAKNSGAILTLNSNIFIQGKDSIYGGIVNNNNKNTEVGGNFYNYNGATSFTGLGAGGGGSTLTFTRRVGANQNFRNNGAALTLNNVTMNQIAAGSLTLNANATSDLIIGSSGILTLTQGKIITGVGTAREVNVTNSAAGGCSAGVATSYVEGKLRRSIAAALNSYDFPVGESSMGYERANITYTVAPSVYNLLAQFKTWGGANCAFPGMGPVASECLTATYNALPYFDHGYWNIDQSGGSTGTYRVTLYNSGMSNNTGMGWTVVKGTSGSCAFALAGNCWVASTAGATRRDNLTSFSDFATVQSQNPLPIQLLYFNAKPEGYDVLCSWSTATEINNDHFELERSADGNEFTNIARVKGFGAGVSVHTLSYNYPDKEICNGIIYYRLKQVDIDGNSSYSNVVAVNCKDADRAITVFPNPANTVLNVSFAQAANEKIELQVINMLGMMVMKKEFTAQEGQNNTILEIKDFPPGVYYLKFRKEDGSVDDSHLTKFLKY